MPERSAAKEEQKGKDKEKRIRFGTNPNDVCSWNSTPGKGWSSLSENIGNK
jgi:hypothetical protein